MLVKFIKLFSRSPLGVLADQSVSSISLLSYANSVPFKQAQLFFLSYSNIYTNSTVLP
jgi:hypothetical protein